MKKFFLYILSCCFWACQPQLPDDVEIVKLPDMTSVNLNYQSNRAPLQSVAFIKLPLGSVCPQGWIREMLVRQSNGLAGHLDEISAWLDKRGNAWFGTGDKYAWEELPYWLRGYVDMAYLLDDATMKEEAQLWLEAIFASQREDGWFGPIVDNRHGGRDAWPNMLVLFALQHYYEYTSDQRVIDLMTRYFQYQQSVEEKVFLKSYVENSRGGDNLYSILWLYNQTGEKWLLEVAEKVHKNTANWKIDNTYPNWHNVNIAECFREPAVYYQLSGKKTDLLSTYEHFSLVRRIFGQVPGGMFGADENCRMGFIDPRQATETCGFAEQMTSDGILTCITGDVLWADNCEDILFNSFPAAFMPDMRALRYFTAPNMVVSDRKNYSPGIQNKGTFMMMNPFSSRCCQHNHVHAIPYYIQNLVLASNDNGLVMNMYNSCDVNAKVGDNIPVKLHERTNYPFEESIEISLELDTAAEFPLYLRIPGWCKEPRLLINGKKVSVKALPGNYFRINRQWLNGDSIELVLPMNLRIQRWPLNKNSASVYYGPLSFSLLIEEKYSDVNAPENSFVDSEWQQEADTLKWRAFEIYPGSSWNYGLVLDERTPEKTLKLEKGSYPKDNFPFTSTSTPIRLRAKGKLIPGWTLDQYGLCDVLPDSTAVTASAVDDITLIPMGAARLRISAFPVVK